MRVVVVGGGAFGVSAAIELRQRGHEVLVVDPGPLPHPDAASSDLSKLVRCDYGADELYTKAMELALGRWREWNAGWVRAGGRALFHETGFLLLSSEPFAAGSFEFDSHALLSARGHLLERFDERTLVKRFPVLKGNRFVDGYRNPLGGWAESGAVMVAETERARALGVVFEEGFRLQELSEFGGRVVGVRSTAGRLLEADSVVLATGTWTQKLLPELQNRLRSSGQPVFVFRPAAPALFAAPAFLPWAADMGRTGWYGFSATADGLVKVANHGAGRHEDPDAPRQVAPADESRFRAFLRGALPSLAEASLAFTRLCFYSDMFDGDFLIDRHPERLGLVVATGDSGHAFKFMPVLGEWIADAVEGRDPAFGHRFCWRELGLPDGEQGRCRE